MEPKAIDEFITFSEHPPIQPGLYLLINDKNYQCTYTIVSLVEIRYENNILIADSDNWETYLSLKDAIEEYPGIWSKQINFED